MGKLASEVNARLDGGSTKSDSKSGSSGDVYLVKVTCDALNIRKVPGTGYAVVGCICGRGTYAIVGTSGNWGRLKSGVGWICLDYTPQAGSAKASSAKAADIDAMARAVIRGDYGNGEKRRCRLGEKYAAVRERAAEMRGRLHEELAWGLADVLALVFCLLVAPLALLLWLMYGRH